jgi:hypothetical protein
MSNNRLQVVRTDDLSMLPLIDHEPLTHSLFLRQRLGPLIWAAIASAAARGSAAATIGRPTTM